MTALHNPTAKPPGGTAEDVIPTPDETHPPCDRHRRASVPATHGPARIGVDLVAPRTATPRSIDKALYTRGPHGRAGRGCR
jgi:hypothetical protein